ncbi:MAG: hypothetical protein ABWY13_04160 [Mesorhizobium sp.]|jgi:hypothetical protein
MILKICGAPAAPAGSNRFCAWLPLLFASIILASSAVVTPAWSLSEIKREEAPAPAPSDDEIQHEPLPPVNSVPLPDPIQTTPPSGEEQTPPEDAEPDEAVPQDGGPSTARPAIDPDAPPPEVIYDLAKLPEPVRRMRQLIVDTAQRGDIEGLRPLLGMGEGATQLSLGGIEGDPITFLRELSGDKEGHEILAILEEVLSAGYVHLDAGTPNELYVWPYFFAIPLDKLDARQRVELFKIVTAGDYEDMKAYGSYIFYRVGITPDGRWSFFVAGD